MSDQSNETKRSVASRIPGVVAYVVFLLATLMAALWGTVEFFHEGWFPPYTQVIYYAMPFLILMCLTLVSIVFPRTGGFLIIVAGIVFTLWRVSWLKALHYDIGLGIYMMAVAISLPGLLFFLDGVFRKRYGFTKPSRFTFKGYWRQILVVGLPLLLMLVAGIPLLIRNISRLPLESYNEVRVEGNDLSLTFAGDGPGWLYSNKHPVIFGGKKYSGISWNEIALFGKTPIGFEGKRHGLSYDGTRSSVSHATQEDFNRYNMFRYINDTGTELTDSIQDHWRLATIDEYVKILTYRGKNAGGQFDSVKGEAVYTHQPDKEGPIWAHDKEVIYYWTSTSLDEQNAFNISFLGEPGKILKTTAQDYRGYRAVRTELSAR